MRMSSIKPLIVLVTISTKCAAFSTLSSTIKPFNFVSPSLRSGFGNPRSVNHWTSSSRYFMSQKHPHRRRQLPATPSLAASSAAASHVPTNGGSTPLAACVVNLIKNIVRILASSQLPNILNNEKYSLYSLRFGVYDLEHKKEYTR